MKSTVEVEGTIPYKGCAHASRFILKGESKGKIQHPFRSSQRALSILPNQRVGNFEKFSRNTGGEWVGEWGGGGGGGVDTVGIQNLYRGISPIYQETVYKLS